MSLKLFAVTTGEPAGIGPDLAVMQWQKAKTTHNNLTRLIHIGDPAVLSQRASQLNIALTLHTLDASAPLGEQIHAIENAQASHELKAAFYCLPIHTENTVQTGVLDVKNSHYVLKVLDAAIALCQSQQTAAMITLPVQKSVINEAGIAFSGHTEYLADKTNTAKVVMMLATADMRVCLATTHLPLKDVAQAITQTSLEEVIRIIHQDLAQFFGIQSPRLLVCGLNPHAGEDGHLGDEEITTISPVLNKLKQAGLNLIGPLPADTLFTPKVLEQGDAVLAMYHDQGLPVLKFHGFGQAANITLGLPIVRTSVDHGTALDLAGTGNIHLGSFDTAITIAEQMSA